MNNPMAQGIEKLLTVEDVMDTLRISRPTLYRMLNSGRLQPVRIGKRTLFDPADIRGLIKEAKKGAKPRASQERSTPEGKATNAAPRTRKTLRTEDAAENPKASGEKSADDGDKQGRLL